MGIHTKAQLLAQDCIHRLNDKRVKCFGKYMSIIAQYGEQKIYTLLSEVVDDYKVGRIDNKLKVFWYKIRTLNTR
jgi:hypothetical protein